MLQRIKWRIERCFIEIPAPITIDWKLWRVNFLLIRIDSRIQPEIDCHFPLSYRSSHCYFHWHDSISFLFAITRHGRSRQIKRREEKNRWRKKQKTIPRWIEITLIIASETVVDLCSNWALTGSNADAPNRKQTMWRLTFALSLVRDQWMLKWIDEHTHTHQMLPFGCCCCCIYKSFPHWNEFLFPFLNESNVPLIINARHCPTEQAISSQWIAANYAIK